MVDELKTWLTDHRRDIVIFVLFFLISSISFGLGYLMAYQGARTPIIIEKNSPSL